jgi:outer membrane biosynthesis protein TonB
MLKLAAVLAAVLAVTGCSTGKPQAAVPQMAARGTNLTTAKLSKQDLTNKVSLSGKVTMNPIFGLVAPIDGQVRYVEVKPPDKTPTKPTKVASVVSKGKATPVEIPASATFTGRLVDDQSTVTAGMPIISAKYIGYGIVADIDSAQAYKLADALGSVAAQVKNGPGPFPCTVLGTIAALPAGTVPAPPADPNQQQPDPQSQPPPSSPQQPDPQSQPSPSSPQQPTDANKNAPTRSESTGLRLVCIAPQDVKLINGAATTLQVITERAAQALVAPVEAVAGGQGTGKVDVLTPDGTRQTRDVTLGITDGRVIEIKSGLTGDETLAVPGPNLPDAPSTGNRK